MQIAFVLLVGLWAGAQNALAGGGTFVALPVLMLSGMSPLAANITSTVALFPGQVASGVAGRRLVAGADRLPFSILFIISVIGGALGGVMLLKTPTAIFTLLVPWLVLFATIVFAWGSFLKRSPHTPKHLGRINAAVALFVIAIYGGYFGGGIGFLMMAILTMAGLSTRNASATKNVLAGVMNAAAVALFVTSPQLHWKEALALGFSATVGGLLGSWALYRVNEKALRVVIVCMGGALTIGLFLKPI